MRSKKLLTARHSAECQAASSIGGPFPAVVLNVASCGQPLGLQATLEELSASGFYLRLPQRVGAGERLLVVTQVSQAVILLCGAVARVEELADGAYGLAVVIAQHQLFPLKTHPMQTQTDRPPVTELLSREV